MLRTRLRDVRLCSRARGSSTTGCRRTTVTGEICHDDVAQHLAIVRPATPLAEVAPENRLEGVSVGNAKDAERTYQHVHIERIDSASNGAPLATTSQDARDQVHRACVDA